MPKLINTKSELWHSRCLSMTLTTDDTCDTTFYIIYCLYLYYIKCNVFCLQGSIFVLFHSVKNIILLYFERKMHIVLCWFLGNVYFCNDN